MIPKKNDFLEFPPDTINITRKKYNLHEPGRMDEALNMVDDWIKKQNHFFKKDFDKHYLERCLITCKGSIERTKERIDKLCTLKTLLPDYFSTFIPNKDFANRHNVICSSILPKMDPTTFYRVLIIKVLQGKYTSEDFTNFFKEVIVLAEYLMTRDYADGFILVFDYSNINLMDLLSAVNLVQVKDILALLMKGYGMRVKSIHVILPNSMNGPLIDFLWTIIKQIVSEKIATRTLLHKSVDELHNHVYKDILPKEYGGNEKPLADLYEKLIDEISSNEHINYMQEINKAKVDEKLRASRKFNEEYLGLPGSFRQMNVD